MFIFESISDVFLGLLEALDLIHIANDLTGYLDDILMQNLLEQTLADRFSLMLHANHLQIS